MLSFLRSRGVQVAVAAAGVGAAALWASRHGVEFPGLVSHASSPPASALSPQEWRAFKLVHKQPLTANTELYRFGLPDPHQEVGLPVASCMVTRAPIGSVKDDGSRGYVIRPYTPTSEPHAKGHFDLVIKKYPDGKMSQHIAGLKVGDSLECKGPIMKVKYEPNMKKAIGMVAGGTGITPMLQVAEEVLRNPRDRTQVSLIYGNVSEDDIILKQHIDDLAAKHKNFQVYYVVDKASSSTWQGGVGYVTKDMLKAHLPPPGSENLVLVCGPPGLMNAISGDKAKDKSQGELTGALKDLGYSPEMVYKF